MAAAEYDIFLSHAWADGARPQQIKEALTAAELRVWFDAAEIDDFAGITRAVTDGLAKSKALLAYYSATYPLRRACQWELTAAFLAAQTEGDPRRRVLVINPENGADHIHPIELRDAKFRNAPNTDDEMQQLVQAILTHVVQLDGPLPDIRPLDPPPWHGIKPVRYERFVGRFQEMWKIHSALHETRVVQITGASGQDIAQVTGLGGIGKSLLAREYALRFGPAYPGGIFWLSAYGNDDAKATLSDEGREAERSSQLRKFAQDFGIDVEGKEPDEILTALRLELERSGQPCLWIVDDLPSGLNAQSFQPWCAPHPLAQTLITTRSRTYRSLSAGILHLDVLPEDDAYQLLTWRRKPASKDEDQQARGLANDLGHHALALDVTASALQSYGGDGPYRTFRGELSNQDGDALDLSTELADALPTGHEKNIAQTMLRSIRGLGAEGQDFLRLASVLAVAPIPAPLVTAVFETADGLDLDKAAQRQRKAFHQVTSASLAEITGGQQNARSVHTLVSRAFRFQEKAEPERTQALRTAAMITLLEEIAEAAEDPRLHKQIEFHVAHARQVVALLETIPEANLVSWLARYDLARGAYASARTLYEREFEFRRHALGEEHPDTLTERLSLAQTLYAQGDLAGARQHEEQVLEARRRLLGEEHPDTLTASGNLAVTLIAQGDLAGARLHQEQVLEAIRRLLGEEHPDTLTARLNLAETLSAQGDLAGARQHEEQVLEARRRLLGEEHPDTLTARGNLAITLIAQGDLAGARLHQEQVLEASWRLLGEEHPDTLTARNNLAQTLQDQGDLAGARQQQDQVLEVSRRLLGEEHPKTLTARNNLAQTLSAQGDFAGARQHEEQVLEARRRLLGEEHPDTLTARGNLAATLYAQRDLAGARLHQEQVLEAIRRLLGEEHPETLGAHNNLAATLYAQGDLAGARLQQEQVLEASWRLLGEEHPDTLKARSNLAGTLIAQGDLAGARKLQEKTLEIRRHALGLQHPDTSTSAWWLCLTLQALGDREAARTVLERDLLWLLDRDPSTLGVNQRNAREYLARAVKDHRSAGQKVSLWKRIFG